MDSAPQVQCADALKRLTLLNYLTDIVKMPVEDQLSKWQGADSDACSADKDFSDGESLKKRIADLEGKLSRQDHQLSVLQHLAGVFATMPKPNQIGKMLLELFCRELHAVTSMVWLKGRYSDVFRPLSGVGLNKRVCSEWKLPAPNPFPDTHMLLLRQQWLEKQTVLPHMTPLLGPGGNLALYYLPFEYNAALMGFAIMGIDPDHSIDEEEENNALEILGRQVGASIYNSHLFLNLSDQRDELKYKTDELEKANESLMKMDRFKNEFLVITSHELRTPLTGALGFIKLVMEGMYQDEEEMRQMLQDSYSSGKYLLKLLNDILDLAKIESGNLKVDLRPVSVKDRFAEIKTITHSLPRKSNVAIHWPDDLESLPDIIADPDRFSQVMINLLSNALKFTLEGSVSVIAERDIGFINFSVIDTGIGISLENQGNLFQKFVQVHSGHSRGFSGTGLGLLISKHLVELMGGAIEIHSEGEGRGATVRFRIPIG
ncbi:MAG: HAMP domain-containing histidine kinase [Holophagales bacterium]|jgi:signal transduction histidine kinase|nr:HAMP domain-containing histidine kinase [Holophagales bacterium]